MRILVCGDRHWTDRRAILRRLEALRRLTEQGEPLILIHGDARGADRIAGAIGAALGFTVLPYPADWKFLGSAAGPVRNREMLSTGPDLVLAFHANLDQSKGTKDCVTEARRRGIPVEVVS